MTDSKVTYINADVDDWYKPEVLTVTQLLNTIEVKFKRCESLYYLFFEDADHGVLNGNSTTLPVGCECSFIDGTATIEQKFVVNDRHAYKEIIDLNFQTFILTTASLYENLVMLAEIFLKKVVVYLKRPPSSTLHDYIKYVKLLANLGYHKNSKLQSCLTVSDPYFVKYLGLINELRNKFIHGYSINLESDGFNYYVAKLSSNQFTSQSPDLQLDVFAKNVLDETRSLVCNLMNALHESGKHHRKSIPA